MPGLPLTEPARAGHTMAPPVPALRLLPAPTAEPPYDDDLRPGRPALRLVPELTPEPAAPPRPRPQPARRPDFDQRTPTSDLPDATACATALVQRLLEVCGGVRPTGQLQWDTSAHVYDDLQRALQQRPRPSGPRPTRRDIRSVHVQERPDGVAEVCATVRRGGRLGALALRLEGRGGRWVCTAMQGV